MTTPTSNLSSNPFVDRLEGAYSKGNAQPDYSPTTGNNGVYRQLTGASSPKPVSLSPDGRQVLDSLGRPYKSPATEAYEQTNNGSTAKTTPTANSPTTPTPTNSTPVPNGLQNLAKASIPTALGLLLDKPVGAAGQALGNALLPLVKNIDERLGQRPDPKVAELAQRVEKQYQEALANQRHPLPSPSRGSNSGLPSSTPSIPQQANKSAYYRFSGEASEEVKISNPSLATYSSVENVLTPASLTSDGSGSWYIVSPSFASPKKMTGDNYPMPNFEFLGYADGSTDPVSEPPYVDTQSPDDPRSSQYFPYRPTVQVGDRAARAYAPTTSSPDKLPFKDDIESPPFTALPSSVENPANTAPRSDSNNATNPTNAPSPTNGATNSNSPNPQSTPVSTSPLDPTKQPSTNQNPLTSPLNPPRTTTPPSTSNTPALPDLGTISLGLIGLGLTTGAILTGLNEVKNNTTPTAQQTNAKQGVCDAMQPQQCGFEGVKQATTEATAPIKDQTVANAGAISAIANLLATIWTFLQNNLAKVLQLLNNSVVDRTLAVMNLATNIHNAAMLTRDIGETLGSVVDNVISLSPLRFTNSEGSQVQFTDFIGSNFRSFLISVLGAENYVSLVINWQKANTIYHATMGVINTTQSMLDPISSAVEYGMENVSKIGNSLKEDGVVSENAYPAMDETIRARRVNRFERLNDTLEGAENIASNLSSVTSSAVSVKEDYKQLREDAKDLKDKATAFNTADSEARAALKAELPTEITPITLAPAPAEDEEP